MKARSISATVGQAQTGISSGAQHVPKTPTSHRPWPRRAGCASASGPRDTNEDCCYANVHDGIFLVADGVGGNPGGALASQLLVDTVPAYLTAAFADGQFCRESLPGFLPELMQQAVNTAQRAMSDVAARQPSVAKMGSTIVLGIVAEGVLYLTHLGDSRAYMVRHGTIRQLTKDHTLIQVVIDCGKLSREEAEQHPFRHVILKCVSAAHVSAVQVVAHELLPDDRLVFTTDGVTNAVDDATLEWIVTQQDDPQLAAIELVRLALDHKTRDNATCVVIHTSRTR
jgi:protein phosphatase